MQEHTLITLSHVVDKYFTFCNCSLCCEMLKSQGFWCKKEKKKQLTLLNSCGTVLSFAELHWPKWNNDSSDHWMHAFIRIYFCDLVAYWRSITKKMDLNSQEENIMVMENPQTVTNGCKL